MSNYRVDLDIFAGPLDLLLYLVRKDEVDIYDIPIAQITEQYIEYIEMLKMFDIDLAGDFLVMAATLMEIKSIMLLPKPEIEDETEGDATDPRTELVRQLLEYKKFKDAANLLQDAAEERKQRFTRSNYILEKIKPTEEPELDLDQVSIWTLLESFDTIMRSVGKTNTSYDHIKDDTPIDLYQIELLHRLQTEGPMTLQKVFEGRDNRLVMIGLFLGMLELMRNHLIWVEQPDRQGPIYLKPLTSEPAEEAVHNAIYANPEAMEVDQQPDDGSAAQEQSSDESDIDEPELSAEDDLGSEINEESALNESATPTQKPPVRIMELPADSHTSVAPAIPAENDEAVQDL
jgi:segregation and condensation protein A